MNGRAPKVVSHRALVGAWESAIRSGVSPSKIGDDMRTFVERARVSHERIDWDTFIELYDRVRAIVGGGHELKRVFADYHPAFPEWGRFAKLFVSPSQLLQFMQTTVGVAMFSHLECTFEETGRDRAFITARIPSSFRDGTAFFEGTIGGISTMTRLLGLPPAEVDGEVTSHSAEYRVKLPPSRTLPTRVTPAIRGLLEQLHGFAEEIRHVTLNPMPSTRTSLDVSAGRFALTPRQREVAALVMRGASNKEIAGQLGCAERTVELHVTALMRKTGTTNRTQLAAVLLSS